MVCVHFVLLDLHIEQLHQGSESSNIQQQKDVIPHPVLHLRLRAALAKRPWNAKRHHHNS